MSADAAAGGTIRVEVAYALPHAGVVIAVDVPSGTTARAAAERSGITRRFPDIDLATATFGIFGQVIRSGEQVLVAGDRVEIYRPLLIDPKEARRRRARGDDDPSAGQPGAAG